MFGYRHTKYCGLAVIVSEEERFDDLLADTDPETEPEPDEDWDDDDDEDDDDDDEL